jgi:hypothetical protein
MTGWRRPRWYVLEGRTPVPVENVTLAGRRFALDNRQVAKTRLGRMLVSTVFLGLDHSFTPGGPPILFETMVFEDGASVECWRCATFDEAEAQHAAVVDKIRRQGL